MAKSAAERMRESRARARGELPALKRCSVCGVVLKPTGSGRGYEAGLCFKHWSQSDEGKKYLRESRQLRRAANTAPTPFRYFGALLGEEAYPEGPFNRMRLGISSTYAGKNKPRGTLFIVWSDDVVTVHHEVRQSDVGAVSREDGEEVDRSDLAHMARTMPPLTERTRHHGHGDVYLV